MNIGNITSNNMNLTENGRFMQIELYEKEIERLNARVKECEKAYLRTRQQYSELESKYVIDEYIINELEKYLEERVSKSVLKGCSFEQTYITGKWYAYKNSLNKLQKLKGDSSNE